MAMEAKQKSEIPVVDFHSHVLPGIDDGSKSPEMSEEMLSRSREQGVDVMVATPHFYADCMTMDSFCERRASALRSVRKLQGDFPRVLCGAEVAFFPGVSRAEELERLQIEGTNLLLLEMPFDSWTQYELQEVRGLLTRGIQPVIAHLERFYSFKNNGRMIQQLLELPVYIQINAEALTTWSGRRKVLPLFRAGLPLLLGSDCHNTSTRPPNLRLGRELLEKKLGAGYLDEMDAFTAGLLNLQPAGAAEAAGRPSL